MKTTHHSFRVIGKGQFPLDMLRHDRCWPATPKDAAACGCWDWERTIELFTIDPDGPTVKRWASFCWPVLPDVPASLRRRADSYDMSAPGRAR